MVETGCEYLEGPNGRPARKGNWGLNSGGIIERKSSESRNDEEFIDSACNIT